MPNFRNQKWIASPMGSLPRDLQPSRGTSSRRNARRKSSNILTRSSPQVAKQHQAIQNLASASVGGKKTKATTSSRKRNLMHRYGQSGPKPTMRKNYIGSSHGVTGSF